MTKVCRFVPGPVVRGLSGAWGAVSVGRVRQSRSELPPAGTYHVTTRGVARTAIFLDDDERRLFLGLFAAEVQRHDWRCHVFCLMTTHYHLVVETELWRLSDGMHRLNGIYA